MTEQHKQRCDCGCMGFGPAISNLMNSMGPKEARQHFRSARLEFLKGMRAVLDARISHLTKQTDPNTGTTVPVE